MRWIADEHGQVKEPPMLMYAKVVRALSCTNDERISSAVFELLCRNELGAEAAVVLTRYGACGDRYRVLWADLSDAAVATGGIGPLQEIAVEARTSLDELVSDLSPCVRDIWRITPGDPLESRLGGFRSLMSLPLYFEGVLDGIVVLLRSVTDGFDSKRVPEMVCLVNLIGRNLRNRDRELLLRDAVGTAERELYSMTQMQQQILRSAWPVTIRHAAVGSEPGGYANGDYYALIPLPGGEFAVFLADVSGNGAAAALAGAVLHGLTHVQGAPLNCPSAFMKYMNQHLTSMRLTSMFATAGYAVYAPGTRVLRYCLAGLPALRVASASGAVRGLASGRGLPLGVRGGEEYEAISQTLMAGDRVAFYTDGVTESDARGAGSVPMEVAGLDRLLSAHCRKTPAAIVRAVMEYLGPPALDGSDNVNADDRTIIVLGDE